MTPWICFPGTRSRHGSTRAAATGMHSKAVRNFAKCPNQLTCKAPNRLPYKPLFRLSPRTLDSKSRNRGYLQHLGRARLPLKALAALDAAGHVRNSKTWSLTQVSCLELARDMSHLGFPQYRDCRELVWGRVCQSSLGWGTC